MSLSFQPSLPLYKLLTCMAALFMLLPLPVMQYVGEEGLMALKSYEMFVRDDWLHPSILGMVWPHSPVWHWPVIAISQLIGWEHVDIAVRLVSVCASWISAFAVGMMAAWLFEHRLAGWLGALIYLSMGEVAFWYGWLGYVDATFGMFLFTAIAALWRAIADEHGGWLLLSVLLISMAFLTKNITAYALYGAAALVLLYRLERWHLLKNPIFLCLGAAALSVPFLWQWLVIAGGQSTASTTLNDVLRNFLGYTLLDYLKHWLTLPLIFLFRAMPVSLLLLWFWLTRKHRFTADHTIVTIALLLLACFLPFWLSAGGTPRYLVPLYGIAALLLTGLVLQLEHPRLRQSVLLIALVIAVKIPYSLAILPYIKDWREGRDVKIVAHEIIEKTLDAPLRTQNDVATGLAVAAYIDVWRAHRPPIRWYDGKERGVYILAETETPQFGTLIKTWHLRGDHLYLYRKIK